MQEVTTGEAPAESGRGGPLDKPSNAITFGADEDDIGASVRNPVKRRRKLLMIGLIALVLATYCNSISGSFVQDDKPQIVESPMFGGSFAQAVKQAFTRDFWANIEPDRARDKIDSVYYRPVFVLTLLIGHHVAGTSPRIWHLIAILLHALTAVLVFLAIDKMLALATTESDDSRLWMSAVATSIFIAHPVQSESVAWISGLIGPLSTAFMVGAFICYLAYRQKKRVLPLVGVAVLFAAAVFAKEQTVVLPGILLCCELLVFRRSNVKNASGFPRAVLATMMVVVAIYLSARYCALGVVLGHSQNLNFPDDRLLTLGDELRTIPELLVQYGRLVIYPANLSLMYSIGYVTRLSANAFWLPLAGTLTMLALITYASWRFRELALAAIWILLPLLPHLSIRAFVSDEIIHDRYLYGSMIGVGMLVTFSVRRVTNRASSRGMIRGWAAGIVVVVLVVVNVMQNRQWKSNETLWNHAAATAPNSRLVRIALGAMAENRRDLVAALREYEAALKICPASVDALNNAALVGARMGGWSLATQRFERIVELTPDKAIAHFNLSFAYAVQKRYGDAIREQQLAIELDPHGPRTDEWQGRLAQLERAAAGTGSPTPAQSRAGNNTR